MHEASAPPPRPAPGAVAAPPTDPGDDGRALRLAAAALEARPPWLPWAAAALALGAAHLLMDAAPLGLPHALEGDALWVRSVAQTLAETGWWFHAPRLGAPDGQHMLSFPMADHGHLAGLWLLLRAGLSPVAAINAYFLLTFAAVAHAAACVLLRLGAGALPALVGSLALALLPYHFLHGTSHLFLAGYFLVPWAVLVVLQRAGGLVGPRCRPLPRWGCWLVALLLPPFGGYYAYFFAYLLAGAALAEAAARRRWAPLRAAAAELAVCAMSLLACLLPGLVYVNGGGAPLALGRPAAHSELFALRPLQLLLPAPGHAHPWLAWLTATYRDRAPLRNEAENVALGLVVGGLFVWGCGRALVAAWRPGAPLAPLARRLLWLQLAAALFAVGGGLGAGQAYFLTPFIRVGARMGVFMACLAVAAAAVELQAWLGGGGRRRAAAAALGCAAALALNLWDTADIDLLPQRAAARAAEGDDAAFFAGLEADLPRGARLFSYPALPFPEGGVADVEYFPLRPYVHSRALRLSFASMRGSPADRWSTEVAGLAAEGRTAELRRRLRAADFAGILVSRSIPLPAAAEGAADADPGRALEALLGPPQRRSADGEFYFFAL